MNSNRPEHCKDCPEYDICEPKKCERYCDWLAEQSIGSMELDKIDDKHSHEYIITASWNDLKKWLESLKKTNHDLKEFADIALTRMKKIREAQIRAAKNTIIEAIQKPKRIKTKEVA